jgi:CBS-domain-containing membrane protein
MNSAIERLLSLRVSDVMNSPVTTVSECDSMPDAARVLIESEIRGAPVVDATGRCVGMLSGIDFAQRANRIARGDASATFGQEHALRRGTGQEAYQMESIAEDRVREHMSPAVQTIHRTSTLINAARMMCREHIHRLVIVDEDARPIGVVSSLDIVAAMIAAIEE